MDSGRRSNMSDMTTNEDGFFPEDPIENPDLNCNHHPNLSSNFKSDIIRTTNRMLQFDL